MNRSLPAAGDRSLLPKVALLAAAAFAILTYAVIAGGYFDTVDQRLLHAFAPFEDRAPAWLLTLSTWFQFSGSAGLIIVTPLLLIFWLLGGRRRRFYLLLIGVGGCQPVWMALQFGIGRERPTPVSVWPGVSLYSYPSGHTMLNTAFYGILYTIIAYDILCTAKTRRLLAAVLLVLLLLIGLNRLFFGVHYLSDVIGGYLAGLAWTAFAVWLVDRFNLGRRSADAETQAAS